MSKYLRFQGKQPNPASSSMLGIFQLAFELRDHDETPLFVQSELQHHLGWLKRHLKSPEILNQDEHRRAISWFHERAARPLEHIWSIKALLDEHGYPIDVIKSKDPGVVIYEDGWQVIAKPRHKRVGRDPHAS